MDGIGKTLTVPDVFEINRQMIAHFGCIFITGDGNLANRGSLKYALAEIIEYLVKRVERGNRERFFRNPQQSARC
jgi:hypothetical protein